MTLSTLSGDEQGIILGQLRNALEPRLVMYFSSASKELRALLPPAARQQLRTDYEAATALCVKVGMRGCKALREATEIKWTALEAPPVSGTERQPPMALGERAASSQRRLGEYIRLCVEKRVSAPKVWEARVVSRCTGEHAPREIDMWRGITRADYTPQILSTNPASPRYAMSKPLFAQRAQGRRV